MGDLVRYPQCGCIVEYLEGNAVQIAMVVGENGDRLRLLLPSRRETTLSKNRILPWAGPKYSSETSRDELIRLLEQHKNRRDELQEAINILDVWEMAQGELGQAQAQWFAELVESDPSIDLIAAHAHALLLCKTHFRFQPPFFQIFTAEEAEKRLAEQHVRLEREALLAGGRNFLQLLWEVALGRRKLPPEPRADESSQDWPQPAICERLEALLRTRMLSPYDNDSESLWLQVSRGLPDAPQLPLQLLLAWNKVPVHYNVWLHASGYAQGDSWWENERTAVLQLLAARDQADLPFSDLPFISIDSATTRDIDDAFAVERRGEDYVLTVALSCPVLAWSFDSGLDRLVLDRGTSLYLPEMTCHMLPECLGTDGYSLLQTKPRPALLVQLAVDKNGVLTDCRLSLARIRLAANLSYEDCEQVLSGDQTANNPAQPYAEILRCALSMAKARQEERIRHGAVVMEREEPVLHLEGEGEETKVVLEVKEPAVQAQLVVSECMIAASYACAKWAASVGLPLVHRTQKVNLPQEYAGVWREPERIARIMHSLVPSVLDTHPGPHAALGVDDYVPVTSPLRRYADLVNMAQVVAYLRQGQGLFDQASLERLLARLEQSLERVAPVQRMRPRYWKLVYFRQQGDKVFYKGVICEENDSFVTVNLPREAMSIRARRQLFDDRLYPGMPVRVRIGKVQPLWNELQVLEALPDDNGVEASASR
ncbi:MAG: RNB domain-containing ribonuclease [Desulfovibrio sp.]|nr:RNB domain-containing ribonuclease [Desulfovibrio sp.]